MTRPNQRKGYTPITTQNPKCEWEVPFPRHSRYHRPIMAAYPITCLCSWTYAPDVTGLNSKPFALKFAHRQCRHFRLVRGHG